MSYELWWVGFCSFFSGKSVLRMHCTATFIVDKHVHPSFLTAFSGLPWLANEPLKVFQGSVTLICVWCSINILWLEKCRLVTSTVSEKQSCGYNFFSKSWLQQYVLVKY